MYFVRGSELNSFLRCRLQWKFAWIEGLRPKKPNNKMYPGTLAHKWLETWYTTHLDNGAAWNAMKKLFDETDVSLMEQTELDDLWETVQQVTKNYATQYGTPDQDGSWDVVATELTFAIPLDDEIGYTGTIDILYKDSQGLWLSDHKLTNSLDKYDKNSELDRQISRYLWAVQQLALGNGQVLNQKTGVWTDITMIRLWDDLKTPLAGFVYNLLLRDFPVEPKVLKNGTLSKDKRQNTTAEMYFKALCEHYGSATVEVSEIIQNEYGEILQHLNDSPKEFFRRIQVIRNQAEIDSAMTELYATARDMVRTKNIVDYDNKFVSHGPSPIYRNITTSCPWDCSFYDACKAGLDGSNVDYLIDSLYTREETNNGI